MVPKKSMLLVRVIAFLLFASPIWAQVGNGSTWVSPDGNSTLVVNVDQVSHFNVAEVSYTANGRTSPEVEGELGPGSSESTPNVSDADPSTVPASPNGEEPAVTAKVKDGKVEVKNEAGQWVKWREVKKKNKPQHPAGGNIALDAGDVVPRHGVLKAPGLDDVELFRGDAAPHAGNFYWIGDEVTSLPGPE